MKYIYIYIGFNWIEPAGGRESQEKHRNKNVTVVNSSEMQVSKITSWSIARTMGFTASS
jgi:hypothetical protein